MPSHVFNLLMILLFSAVLFAGMLWIALLLVRAVFCGRNARVKWVLLPRGRAPSRR